ncbi:MAG: DUF4293 family protein [Bacteroidetes bacterium]|nr:DUF4293 family protein [Bacteroidota bacterium]
MIQRKQTLWLAAAVASALLTLKFNFYAGRKNNLLFEVGSSHFFYWLLSAVATAALSGIAIFLFRNRKLQVRLTGIALLISLLFNLLLLYTYFSDSYQLTDAIMSLGALFYFIIPFLQVLAITGIMKDEKLIKSMDRFR